MLLQIIEEHPALMGIMRIETYRIEDGSIVVFKDVLNENGEKKNIRCSNVLIRVLWEE